MSGPQRKLRHLAKAHHAHDPQSLPRFRQNFKGHTKGQRQGIRSTKPPELTATQGDNDKPTALSEACTNGIFTHIADLTKSIHTDQTGAFPYTSQRGNRYIMVAIHLDANYILVAPMRNRAESDMSPESSL